ncbi:unnamed protein product [Musa acuminata subsp. malaccensis]|uniref:(wild Malaysian banana) hypothetical protein n=1 Tax=Musa acuminata subsp. malaccensis TaxID=214687 RepID=A0A804INL7_MUSAM|nr:PREDICTED: uncharacterized protein LOC103981669 [Musa acuminata subsp. malaccensis]CAG1841886.1 unnamed protein product [Musa acuminata subsp. malaccensis]
MGDRVVQDLLAEVERAKQLAQEERRKAGIALDGEDEGDYMRVVPLIEKLEKTKVKDSDSINRFWVPTDSESDGDQRFSPDEVKKRLDSSRRSASATRSFSRTFRRETLDEAHKWMTKIDKFEQRHLKLRLEYRHQQVGSPEDIVDSADFEKEKTMIQGAGLEEDEEDFSETKEIDNILIEKFNAIEEKLEEKLAELDHAFGKKGRVLEEEIDSLVEERNSLT